MRLSVKQKELGTEWSPRATNGNHPRGWLPTVQDAFPRWIKPSASDNKPAVMSRAEAVAVVMRAAEYGKLGSGDVPEEIISSLDRVYRDFRVLQVLKLRALLRILRRRETIRIQAGIPRLCAFLVSQIDPPHSAESNCR
jgi:hypothetical protein